DNQRHRIEPPGPFDAGGVSVYMIRDALLVHEAPGRFPAPLQLTRRKRLEIAEERGVMRTNPAVGEQRLVEAVFRTITGEQPRPGFLVRARGDVAHVDAGECRRAGG